MSRGRGLTSRLLGRSARLEAPVIEWVDPAGLDLRVEWADGGAPDPQLMAEVTTLRDTALPNSWLPYCRRLLIGPAGTVGQGDAFDPETVVLERDPERGRVTIESWLRLGRHCAGLAPMPCSVEEWQEAIRADRRHAKRRMLRGGIGAMARLRELGMDPQTLKGDRRIGERLNQIVNDGMDPRELSPERDFLGDCMCLVAERAGYPVLELRGELLRSVTDHGGCRISRPPANERTMIYMLGLVLDGEVSREQVRMYLEHSNPNRLAILGRVWPQVPRPAVRPF